jgi:hypothetical protein
VADTGGEIYIGALRHTMVGVYMGELFLIGILTIKSVDTRRVSGPLIISCVLLACTIFYPKLMHDMFRPWINSLPAQFSEEKSLEHGPKENSLCRARTWCPLSMFSKIFLDDLDTVRRAIEDDLCSSAGPWQGDRNEFLAPEITEEELEILLPQKIESEPLAAIANDT